MSQKPKILLTFVDEKLGPLVTGNDLDDISIDGISIRHAVQAITVRRENGRVARVSVELWGDVSIDEAADRQRELPGSHDTTLILPKAA